MNVDLSQAIQQLVQEAPRSWLEAVCAELQSSKANTPADSVLQKLPPTHNGDLAYRLGEVVRLGDGAISWEALSSAIAMCAAFGDRWQIEHKTELLWAGPAPASGMPARRIDQVLYDLIATAEKDILLITFAAHKVQRLAKVLASASRRGVRVRLVLEFGMQSQFQLSHDALKAFPIDLQERTEIFYWPIESRELGGDMPTKLREHFEHLIAAGALLRWNA
jgi:phosphatidylserine/phosphatidylglycerophosphate/cardiolipin synthase-like enzyme